MNKQTQPDPLPILLSHDHWATTQILSACTKLPPDAFHRRFDIGRGSLHDTLTHIIAAIRALTDSLAGSAPRPRLDADGQSRTIAVLQSLLDASYAEFSAEAPRRRRFWSRR